MKSTARCTIGFLGALVTATQVFGALSPQSLRNERLIGAVEQAQLATVESGTREDIGSSSKPLKSLEKRVRSELLKLPYYGVFDYLAFQVDNDQVILSGQVHWPSLKTDAERAVRSIEGVAGVSSTIEVLPVSPNDDRIRIEAYRAIYGHSTLARYQLNPHPPIRIIVKNGGLTLLGNVSSEMDRTVAHLQANGVPGTFSVANELQIAR